MNKSFIFGLCTGIAITAISIVTYLPGLAEALYSIPPTNAWQTIIVNSTANYSSTGDTIINATSYKDTIYLLSDGSIGFNITTYP